MNPPSRADSLKSAIRLFNQEELESLLNDSGPMRTLAFLYASKGRSSKALSIWRKLARDFSPNYSRDPSGKIDGQEKAYVTSGQVSDISQVIAVQVLISDKRGNMLFPVLSQTR